MSKWILSTAAALAMLAPTPLFAFEQFIPPAPNGQVSFTTPSGNIGCTYTPKGGTETYMPADGGPELICERIAPSYVTLIMGATYAPNRIDNPGEQGCCGTTDVLKYGNEWAYDAFVCYSETKGLTCLNSAQHGWFVSKAKIAVQ